MKITNISFEINPKYFFVEQDDEYDFDEYAMRICERISKFYPGVYTRFDGCNSVLSVEIKFSIKYDDDDILESRHDDDLIDLFNIYSNVEF